MAPRGATGAAGPPPPTSRFRSFAERYVIERAGTFTTGNELEGAWQALQDAKKIYNMIGEARDPDANYPDATQQAGGATQAPMPIMEAVEAMKAAGMSMAEIRKYIAQVSNPPVIVQANLGGKNGTP